MAIKDHSTAGGRARAASQTPEQRRELARKGHLAAAIATVVNRFPELTPRQIERLRPLLAGGAAAPNKPERATPAPAAEQFVTVGRYAYRWTGTTRIKVGDRVLLPGNYVRPEPFEGVVTELGSDYDGTHADILKILN